MQAAFCQLTKNFAKPAENKRRCICGKKMARGISLRERERVLQTVLGMFWVFCKRKTPRVFNQVCFSYVDKMRAGRFAGARKQGEDKQMQADIVIVGAGPAGIFTALELVRRGSRKKIVLIEKGRAIRQRSCPKSKTGSCVHCEPCAITTGFSGAGAFSDGKLSLSSDVGGDLPQLLGRKKAEELISYTDSIYLEFGADDHVEGVGHTQEVKDIRRRAIQAGLKLVDCPIRHLGTEKAQELYGKIEDYLAQHGVEMLFSTDCADIVEKDGACRGVRLANGQEVLAPVTVIAAGRRGAAWLEQVCAAHGVAHSAGTVDVGVRVEVRNEIMERVNNVLYESKLIGYPRPFKDKVRTFCQNPGGFVSQENYDEGLAVVNGHSFKEKKSENTNLAILCSHHFSAPFSTPLVYAEHIARMANLLGGGQILVQRLGDIRDGKRTWPAELYEGNLTPTLPDAAPGDLSAALPYRTLTGILSFIDAVDVVVPGFAADETLLYAPEVKFYSNRVTMDEHLTTGLPGLYCLGDASGWTRGLMMASVMGVQMARQLPL